MTASASTLITKAIRERRAIRFEYLKPGKVRGFRVANPHVLFGDPVSGNLNVDVVQTGRVSDTPDSFPKWRTLIVACCASIEILDRAFEPDAAYNPQSPKYANAPVKV